MRYNPSKRYKKIPGKLDTCIYCGIPAECQDHVPPVILQYHYEGTDVDFWIVPSCNQCNMILGGKPLETVEKRLLYLFHWYLPKLNRGGKADHERLFCLQRGLKVFGVSDPYSKIPENAEILLKPLPVELPQPAKGRIDFISGKAHTGTRSRLVELWEENYDLKVKNRRLEEEVFKLREAMYYYRDRVKELEDR